MTLPRHRQTNVAGLPWQWQCLVFLIAAAVVVSRKPDVLTNPQFYAEDGSVWYADAYNLGWFHALAIPAGGYLNSLQRLVASLTLLAPLRHAPLVMNLFGIFIQVLPVFFLLSRRCASWWPLPARLLQTAIYFALPNAQEVHVVLTNAPFHFALLAFLVAVAAPPANWRWKLFDIVILVISPLSGPFCLVLLPLLLVFWWLRRERWSLVAVAILTPLVALQGAILLFGGFSSRARARLGATPMLFLRLLTGHVYIGSIHGQNGFAVYARPLTVLVVMLLGTSVLAFCLLRSTLELRLFIAFSMLLFAASLSKPLIAGPLPQWQLLAIDRSARYWFFPMLALLWSLLWCATQRQSKPFRIFGIAALIAMLGGVIRDWRYPPFRDVHFQQSVQKFNAAPAGSVVEIQLYPPEHVAHLIKK